MKWSQEQLSQVVQLGYLLHDRLIRPAMVGVSKAVEPEISASAED